MEDEKAVIRIAEKAIQSIDGFVGLLSNPPSQHTSELNRSGPASSGRPTSTDGPVSPHTLQRKFC